jgi:hypothetical protein
MKRTPLARRGYALVLVMVFLVIFLAMLGTAWRQVASVLRVETARSVQTRRDRGCLLAAIKGMHYLETAATPSSPQEYVIPDFPDYSFTVTFEQDVTDTTVWTVKAVPNPL